MWGPWNATSRLTLPSRNPLYRSLCKRDQYFCNRQNLSLIALSFSSEWLDRLILQRFKVQRYGIPKCVTEIKNMLSLFSLIEPPEIVCTYICIPSILQLHMATPRPAIFILRVGVVYPCSLCQHLVGQLLSLFVQVCQSWWHSLWAVILTWEQTQLICAEMWIASTLRFQKFDGSLACCIWSVRW